MISGIAAYTVAHPTLSTETLCDIHVHTSCSHHFILTIVSPRIGILSGRGLGIVSSVGIVSLCLCLSCVIEGANKLFSVRLPSPVIGLPTSRGSRSLELLSRFFRSHIT